MNRPKPKLHDMAEGLHRRTLEYPNRVEASLRWHGNNMAKPVTLREVRADLYLLASEAERRSAREDWEIIVGEIQSQGNVNEKPDNLWWGTLTRGTLLFTASLTVVCSCPGKAELERAMKC